MKIEFAWSKYYWDWGYSHEMGKVGNTGYLYKAIHFGPLTIKWGREEWSI